MALRKLAFLIVAFVTAGSAARSSSGWRRRGRRCSAAVPVEAVAPPVRRRVAQAPVALVRLLVVLPTALPTRAQRTAELQMEGRPAHSKINSQTPTTAAAPAGSPTAAQANRNAGAGTAPNGLPIGSPGSGVGSPEHPKIDSKQ